MSFYPNLPDELKLKIWEFGAMLPGVHHFKLTPQRNTYRALLRPYAKGNADPSSWRERLALKSVHQLSKDALDPLLRGCQKLIFDSTQDRHRTYTSENGIRAWVDGRADLVVLRPDTTFFALRRMMNSSSTPNPLADLERIALEWKSPCAKRSILQPFRCMCHAEKHDDLRFCPMALGHFVSRIPDLKAFYFVFRLYAGDIVPYPPGKEARLEAQREAVAAASAKVMDGGRKRNARGALKHGLVAVGQTKKLARKVDARPAEDRICDVLEQIRAINKRDNLESFQDRKGMYFEVRRKDTEHILNKHDGIWGNMENMRHKYETYIHERNSLDAVNKQRLLALDFKFLVFVNTKFTSVPADD
ncbi:hypothetical protein F4809DRAFT_412046 [Biscogniauxia mediterranea]|nr:hypothetical protein F4809DRAFT_412046 [Biscogniauxia mediterranea]